MKAGPSRGPQPGSPAGVEAYALVTGASMGLGKFFARALAARKQNLVLVARSKDKLEALANEVRTSHAILAEPVEFDLAAPGAGQRLAQQLRDLDLPINLLVNNAGFGLRGEFWKLSLERQLEMINLHNTAVVELTFGFLPSMIEEGCGGSSTCLRWRAFSLFLTLPFILQQSPFSQLSPWPCGKSCGRLE